MANKPKKKKEPDAQGDIYDDALLDALRKSMTTIPSIINSSPTGTWATSGAATLTAFPNPNYLAIQVDAEDLETCDIAAIRHALEDTMDALYPAFEPEVVHAMDKDYFLPALKVLVYRDGEYLSPQQTSEWKDMELEAECRPSPWLVRNEPSYHSSPHESCDCGIYGSVNLEEVGEYLVEDPSTMSMRAMMIQGRWDVAEAPRKKLCIVEPSPGAKVVVCRKGWKASSAFISEIIEETIFASEASQLLSIAWHREIDIRRLYENRQNY